MKRNTYKYTLFYACCLFLVGNLRTVPEWILLFFYPECSYPEFRTHLSCSLQAPTMGNHHYGGVYASYAGTITISDDSGQIRFQRKHQSGGPGDTLLKVLITQKVNPIFLNGKTINHFEVDSTSPFAFYEIKQIQDAKSKKIYWDTKRIELSRTRIIPYNTIILFANPHHIRIPLGKSSFMSSSQLILPKIYVSDTVTHDLSAMQVLAIRQFFAPLITLYKPGEKEVTTHIFS